MESTDNQNIYLQRKRDLPFRFKEVRSTRGGKTFWTQIDKTEMGGQKWQKVCARLY